jgi:translation initiation factor 4G
VAEKVKAAAAAQSAAAAAAATKQPPQQQNMQPVPAAVLQAKPQSGSKTSFKDAMLQREREREAPAHVPAQQQQKPPAQQQGKGRDGGNSRNDNNNNNNNNNTSRDNKKGGGRDANSKNSNSSSSNPAPVPAATAPPNSWAAKAKLARSQSETAEKEKAAAAAAAAQQAAAAAARAQAQKDSKQPAAAAAVASTAADAVKKATTAAAPSMSAPAATPAAATATAAPKVGANAAGQWVSGASVVSPRASGNGNGAAAPVDDKAPLQRGQVVPPTASNTGGTNDKDHDANGNNNKDGGKEGWRRGLASSLENLGQRSDGVHRYDKQAMLAVFSRNKECPDEIRKLYPGPSGKERLPLPPRENNTGGGGGQGQGRGPQGRGRKGKEPEEPHPDEAEIFDFSKKDDSTFRYQPTRLADGDDPDVIITKARAVLNKLSVTKFDKLSDEFMAVGIDDEALIARAVDLVISKAQMEEHFCFMYADLCAKIYNVWDEGCSKDEDSLGKSFRVALLNKCRDEFDVDRKEEITKILNDATLSQDDKTEREILAKKRYTGHMRFIGELFIVDMVNPKTMHRCIGELIDETDEETLVCMCKLMLTIGLKLEGYDHRKGHDNFSAYFVTIKRLSTEHSSSRMRFMLKDLIEARDNNWTVRREQEKAVHLSDLREPKKSGSSGGHKLGSSAGGSGDARNSSGGRGTGGSSSSSSKGGAAGLGGGPMDEWQTVPTSSKKAKGPGFGPSSSSSAGGKKGGSTSAGGFGALRGATAGKGGSSSKKEGSSSSKSSSSSSSSSSGAGSGGDSSSNPADMEPSALSRQASDVSVASSTVDPEMLPGANGSLEKATVVKVRSIVEEYYMNEDPVEAERSLRELIHPQGMGDAIGASKGAIELVFEKFPQDMVKLCDLICALWGGGEPGALLSSAQATKGLHTFLDNYDETVIDVPKAGAYGAVIIAHLVDAGVVSLSLFDEIPDENMFSMSPRRAAFYGGVLVALLDRPGQTADSVKAQYSACKTDVMAEAAQQRGPKQSEQEAKEEFLGKYALQFLLPTN